MKCKSIIITALIAIVTLASCKDVWDDHYTNSISIKSDLSLYKYIKSQPDLSVFAQMLEVTGYDSILNKAQTYTVWAPVNSGLAAIDLKDTTLITEIVKNHISRFSFPTSGVVSKTIYMLDQKFLVFKKTESGYTFGGRALVQSDIATYNGILHTVDGYVPYAHNLWEYIGKTNGLDSLRKYLYAQNSFEFDVNASVEIGTNDRGQAIYDSIINFSNPILSKIGRLYLEDSVYTAILPSNAAWTKVYNKIKQNYKTLAKDGGAAQQRLNTQWAIVQNLVFKTRIPDPAAFQTLTTTTGNVISHPDSLFLGSTKSELSNGLAYVTDSLRFKASESWQQPIKMEAEISKYGRTNLFSTLAVRSSLGSTYDVSGTKYLVCEPSTVSSTTQNSVTFPIPNVLSGKYRIYCVFVPTSMAVVNDVKKNKVKFFFNHLDATGLKQAIDTVVTVANKLTNTAVSAGIFSTTSLLMTKVFVTEYTFPYCNLYNEKSTPATIVNKLRVENAVKITETVGFDRTLRIDYIILEPVQ
jgi:hypothetical protein